MEFFSYTVWVYSEAETYFDPLFQKLQNNFSVFKQIEKRTKKVRERIQPIEKSNQSADALSNEVQKLNANHA